VRVLDLFCGLGGWSIPFLQDGDEVWGIDIKDYGYPGNLIKADIRELDGYGFSDMDLIIGSPPCGDFSKARGKLGDLKRGLELIQNFERFVREARPEVWAFENVERLEKFYKPPNWRFLIGAQARRGLWTNLNLPLATEYRFPNRILDSTRGRFYASRKGLKPMKGQEFAMIPFPVARFVADSVKEALSKT